MEIVLDQENRSREEHCSEQQITFLCTTSKRLK